jgi:hypothetical protein
MTQRMESGRGVVILGSSKRKYSIYQEWNMDLTFPIILMVK